MTFASCIATISCLFLLEGSLKTIVDILGRRSIHPFPARMAPSIALEALNGSERPLRVLDPMTGSGTVLAVARASGHKALGIDSDPLAVLLSRVWTTPVDPETVQCAAREVLKEARGVFRTLSQSQGYPTGSDDETRSFIRFWFDGYVRRQLAALAARISEVPEVSTQEVLWCALSRLIISKQAGASRAMDLSHSRPHRAYEYGPVKPFNVFEAAVRRVVENCPRRNAKGVGPAASVQQGDARRLPFRSNSIDFVITSPPYLNAIDYLRCSKFSLVWMGFRIPALRDIRAENIGTECAAPIFDDDLADILHAMCDPSELSSRDQRLLARYAHDMQSAIREVSRVLRPHGRAVYVIGDSTIRGTFVQNSEALIELARIAGLSLRSRTTRELPPNRRYLPPPTSHGAGRNLQARMRTEVILDFEVVA